MKSRLEYWSKAESVLCVRPDNIGDVLMTTPAIRALKHAVDGRRITLLTSRAGASIAQHIPEVDAVEVFDPPWYRHEQVQGGKALQDVVQRLAEKRYDAAVLFTVFSQNPLPTAMLCYMAGIPRVAGYCRENPYELMTDWIPDHEPLQGVRHEVQRQLDLATELGARPEHSAMSLQVPDGQWDKAWQVMLDEGLDPSRPWLLLHPGASEARRRYPPERFAEAARAIHAELDTQVVLTGTNRESALARSVAAQAGKGVISIAGKLDMPAFIALVSMAPLVISNNTGPAHIAAAVQTPVVVLYALTNPQHAPWRVAHRVLPFDVPDGDLSRNVLVHYAADRFFTGKAGMASPGDIVEAVAELLDHPRNTAASTTGLVSVAGMLRQASEIPAQ